MWFTKTSRTTKPRKSKLYKDYTMSEKALGHTIVAPVESTVAAPLPVSIRAGWTTDTALQHLLMIRDADMGRYEQRFLAQERAVEAALFSARTATEKADSASERRFESVNEFRATLKDQQSTFITRGEVYALIGVAASIAGSLGGLIGHLMR